MRAAHTQYCYFPIGNVFRRNSNNNKKILFITFVNGAHVSILPWTATDCILKCLPVGSESRKKKCAIPNIWSILNLNTKCVCARFCLPNRSYEPFFIYNFLPYFDIFRFEDCRLAVRHCCTGNTTHLSIPSVYHVCVHVPTHVYGKQQMNPSNRCVRTAHQMVITPLPQVISFLHSQTLLSAGENETERRKTVSYFPLNFFHLPILNATYVNGIEVCGKRANKSEMRWKCLHISIGIQ